MGFPAALLCHQSDFAEFWRSADLYQQFHRALFPVCIQHGDDYGGGDDGQILIGSLCAYAISKLQFPGHQIYFRIIVLSLMFSPVVTAIPTYMIMAKIGWIDSYLAILVPAMGGSLGLYLMKQFIDQLPDSLLEAARIDGAGEFYTYWHIVMPNVKSAWLTLIVLSVQSLWSMGASPFIYTENYKTINYALGQILASGIARAG